MVRINSRVCCSTVTKWVDLAKEERMRGSPWSWHLSTLGRKGGSETGTTQVGWRNLGKKTISMTEGEPQEWVCPARRCWFWSISCQLYPFIIAYVTFPEKGTTVAVALGSEVRWCIVHLVGMGRDEGCGQKLLIDGLPFSHCVQELLWLITYRTVKPMTSEEATVISMRWYQKAETKKRGGRWRRKKEEGSIGDQFCNQASWSCQPIPQNVVTHPSLSTSTS